MRTESDYEKAFDPVDRLTLWQILEKGRGYPQHLTNVMQSLYHQGGQPCRRSRHTM
jgi:hypothetical protein